MSRLNSLRILPLLAACGSAIELSGTVADRLGVPRAGISLAIPATGLSTVSDAAGRWSFPSAGVERSTLEGVSLRWHERGLLLILDRPATVEAEWFDARGAMLGPRVSGRLETGEHLLVRDPIRGSAVWAKVTVDGRIATVASHRSIRASGISERSAGRSLAAAETLVVSMGSRLVASLPVAGLGASTGISLQLDLDSTFPWTPLQGRYGWFRDTRDGKAYRSVRIGNATWMAENLDHAGLKGTTGVCPSSSGSSTGGPPDSCARYGRLYTWAEALAGSSPSASVPVKGICPDGWHLPTTAEWRALATSEGMAYSSLGWSLRATTGWLTEPGLDTKGFRALAGGFRNEKGFLGSRGRMSYWWTSTPYLVQGATVADAFGVDERRGFVDQLLDTYGLGVRCLAN